MRVILLEDIDKFGKKYEVKEVKDGYARNFLIPKKMVKLATKKSLKWAEEQKAIEAQKSEQELEKVQQLASEIDGLEALISVKTGGEKQLFESITCQKISEKLKKLGFEIPKSKIDLAEPIEELGEFPVKIRFDHNLEAEVRIIITEEKSK
jgi:large subunit ribosomal protein L9